MEQEENRLTLQAALTEHLFHLQMELGQKWGEIETFFERKWPVWTQSNKTIQGREEKKEI